MTGVIRRSLGCFCLALVLAVIGMPFAFAEDSDFAHAIGGLCLPAAFVAALTGLIALTVDLLRSPDRPSKARRGVRAKRIGIWTVAIAVPLYLLSFAMDALAGSDATEILYAVVGGLAVVAYVFVGLPSLFWGLIHTEPVEASEAAEASSSV